MQNELYAQHDLKKTGFEERRITKVKKAFDEAVKILKDA